MALLIFVVSIILYCTHAHVGGKCILETPARAELLAPIWLAPRGPRSLGWQDGERVAPGPDRADAVPRHGERSRS